MTQELRENGRSEVVHVISAFVLNIVALAVNSVLAQEPSVTNVAVLVVLLGVILTVNVIALTGLRKGQEIKRMLLNGLVSMYRDEGVADYYDPALLAGYAARYGLYRAAVLATAIASFVVPVLVLTLR